MGKPGLVTCCRLVAGRPGQLVAGLSTRRVILVQADTGAVRARLVEQEEVRGLDTAEVVL